MNIETLNDRLKAKNTELAQSQESFKIFVESEINTSCFEQNAINELLSMMQLKAEMRELELTKRIIEICGFNHDIDCETTETEEEIWNPAEKKPEHGKDVLLEEKDSGIVYVGHYNKYTDKYIWFDQNTIEVSYWAEIPKRKE